MTETPPIQSSSSWRRAKHRVAHSIKLRMVLVFLVLAAAMTFVFFTGAQRAFSVSWREAARPLLMDYVDRLAGDIAHNGRPSVERAQAITERLPLTVRIEGPQVRWASHPGQDKPGWQREDRGDSQRWSRENWGGGKDWQRILQRDTADGHSIEFGINEEVFERRPRLIGYALTALLLLTLLAWLYVRRLLKPLDAIGEGARRFGSGNFSQPIPQRNAQAAGELGELALTINTMGHDIHQMLEAKRTLLLAISHELRSPLTRARLNTELLPETLELAPQREALLRDLGEMARLISDLLESERLAGRHAALNREPVDLVALAEEVLTEVAQRYPGAAAPVLLADTDLPVLSLDPSRMRLLLRNLLDNALRHSAGARLPPQVQIQRAGPDVGMPGGVRIVVRDHGPGVPEDQLDRLTEPFFRPDTARTRTAGGVGLGLTLCQLVAHAHGGHFELHNVHPGLAVTVTLPATAAAGSV
jgi:signal transduction histidine kinase